MTPRENIFSTILSGLFFAVGVFPFYWWLYVLTFAWRASQYLGHWPRYNNPDPKTLPDHFNPATEYLDTLIPWSILFLTVTILTWLVTKSRSSHLRILISSCAIPLLWLGCFALMRLDPMGLMDWIFD